jgi:HEPN domain-containing protein
MQKWDEQAERLRRKAAGDEEAVAAMLCASSVPDEVIGFHAQQAVEKLLKSLLSHRHVAFRRTHDLTELLDLLTADGVEIPAEIAEVRQLGPYAAEFRYEDVSDEAMEPFDRRRVAEWVKRTRQWSNSLFR